MAVSGRSYHKGWQDQRPGFTARVRWYESDTSIRLNFEAEGEVWNRFYSGSGRQEIAQAEYDEFARRHGGRSEAEDG
jgi:hypothetical protein